ncbi:hypothetical protein AB0204_25595, partial [Klebsiella pneumoniae]
YLLGRHYWSQRTPDALERAITYFEQSIQLQPANPQAYAGLAKAYAVLSDWGPLAPRETMPKAKAAAIKALELDPSLADAHAVLAAVKGSYDW